MFFACCAAIRFCDGTYQNGCVDIVIKELEDRDLAYLEGMGSKAEIVVIVKRCTRLAYFFIALPFKMYAFRPLLTAYQRKHPDATSMKDVKVKVRGITLNIEPILRDLMRYMSRQEVASFASRDPLKHWSRLMKKYKPDMLQYGDELSPETMLALQLM